jgi:hypothetical protein
VATGLIDEFSVHDLTSREQEGSLQQHRQIVEQCDMLVLANSIKVFDRKKMPTGLALAHSAFSLRYRANSATTYQLA